MFRHSYHRFRCLVHHPVSDTVSAWCRDVLMPGGGGKDDSGGPGSTMHDRRRMQP